MTDLEKVFMTRDGMSEIEAHKHLLELRKELLDNKNSDPEEILYNEGLEPDYIMDLLP